MKFLKVILFVLLLLMSFLSLHHAENNMFSFYYLIAIPVGLIIILIFAFWQYRSKSSLSPLPILGLISGVLLHTANVKYEDYRWGNQLEEVMTAIEAYHSEHQEYPQELYDLPIVLPSLSMKRHLRYRLDTETGAFILEYNEGFSTVYNYNSERKSWENYVDWAGG